MNRTFSASVIGIVVCFLSPATYSSTVCLSSGQFKDDFVFQSEIVNRSLKRKARFQGTRIEIPAKNMNNPSTFGQSIVIFDGQNIKLDASASNPLSVGDYKRYEAFARGKLFIDFKVCDGIPGDTINAQISFKVKRVGRITTFLPASTSSLGVSARIRDTVENRNIDFRVIENISVGNLFGNFIKISKVPIPVPEVEGTELASTEIFIVQLHRGRTYRFELFAAAKSTSGFSTAPGVIPFATGNFLDPLIDIGLNGEPGIELVDFAMDVATDQTHELELLKTIVGSLQQSLALLSAKFEGLDPSLGSRVDELEDSNALQEENITTLESEQTQLASDMSSISQQVESINSSLVKLQAKIDVLQANFEGHTHEYLTGKGSGHNHTKVSTSIQKEN